MLYVCVYIYIYIYNQYFAQRPGWRRLPLRGSSSRGRPAGPRPASAARARDCVTCLVYCDLQYCKTYNSLSENGFNNSNHSKRRQSSRLHSVCTLIYSFIHSHSDSSVSDGSLLDNFLLLYTIHDKPLNGRTTRAQSIGHAHEQHYMNSCGGRPPPRPRRRRSACSRRPGHVCMHACQRPTDVVRKVLFVELYIYIYI